MDGGFSNVSHLVSGLILDQTGTTCILQGSGICRLTHLRHGALILLDYSNHKIVFGNMQSYRHLRIVVR